MIFQKRSVGADVEMYAVNWLQPFVVARSFDGQHLTTPKRTDQNLLDASLELWHILVVYQRTFSCIELSETRTGYLQSFRALSWKPLPGSGTSGEQSARQ